MFCFIPVSLHVLFVHVQLIASNAEGKSSPSEVLVCTTNPDKPGPPSTPCATAATPYGFTVTWGTYENTQQTVADAVVALHQNTGYFG